MRFWDSSAVIPLLVEEASTGPVTALLEGDPVMLVWWGTEVECVSALARHERDGSLSGDRVRTALAHLDDLAASWHEVDPGDQTRRAARRLLLVHPLRAADALQLAAAVIAAEGRPDALEFVTLDDRLSQAAEREGFRVTGG